MSYRQWVLVMLCFIIAMLVMHEIGKWPAALCATVLYGVSDWLCGFDNDEEESEE